jgi:predicted nucleic acid-binding protein
MNQRSCFLDSNIWLYYLLENQAVAIQERERKRGIAKILIDSSNIVVSTQVINEVCANALRKAAFTEAQIQLLIQSFENRCAVVAPNVETLIKATGLRSQYHFSFWDGLIIASALFANAEVLYSEDMHDGLVVEQQLTITMSVAR